MRPTRTYRPLALASTPSVSGTFQGDQGQAVFKTDDEPFGANDSVPTAELYANKHVCVTTGDHLTDTPADVREWNDVLPDILAEYDA